MSTDNTLTHTTANRVARIAANVGVVGLWLWLYQGMFGYLSIIFSREDFRTNQIVLVGVAVLIAVRVRTSLARGGRVLPGRVHPRLDASPQLSVPALTLVLGGSALYLLVERFLDINTISASLFGLASYGLLGLWMEPARWREGLPAALLLLIGALPFGEHLQTFVGYPARIFTAALVRDGLAGAGVASVGVDTILVLENGVSQVDVPCSGVKSLWTGALFLIAATWIERRRLNLRWLLTALAFAALLLAANVARVGVLVVVGQVAGWETVAEMIHVPLGVLGFVVACAAVVVLLRLQPVARGSDCQPDLTRPAWLAPALAAVILAMALVYTPRPQTGLAQAAPTWEFPAGLVTEPMPLRPDEIEWLTRGGANSATRLRFEWRDITGSMILITSNTWRAQHWPERCFEVYGLSLDDSRTYLVAPDFPVRFLSLSDGEGHSLASAAYWFQSAGRTTDDYGTRMWADLALERERWVLVTILFDDVHDPRDPDVQTFYIVLHQTVARNLE
ncbi:MAG: exosortase O [Chloroflexi bacterium]|nr:MAG: exosortase O [Chloroflexota bacterium]